MPVLDYYDLLGLTSKASSEEIRKAFRALTKKYHPDKNNKESDEEMFLLIKEAYNTLSDKEKKEKYDKSFFSHIKKTDEIINYNKTPKESTLETPPPFLKDKKQDPSSWLNLKVLARSKNKKSSENQNEIKHKIDDRRTYQVSVDALESLRGATREIVIKNSSGEIKRIKVEIPSGITSGTIIYAQKEPERPESKTLIPVKVGVTEHPYLKILGLDLYLTLPITVGEAFMGLELEVPTYKSAVKVKIPPLTKNKSQLRIKNKGMISKNGLIGDFYVRPLVLLPDKTSDAAIQAAQFLDTLYEEPIRKNFLKKIKEE